MKNDIITLCGDVIHLPRFLNLVESAARFRPYYVPTTPFPRRRVPWRGSIEELPNDSDGFMLSWDGGKIYVTSEGRVALKYWGKDEGILLGSSLPGFQWVDVVTREPNWWSSLWSVGTNIQSSEFKWALKNLKHYSAKIVHHRELNDWSIHPWHANGVPGAFCNERWHLAPQTAIRRSRFEEFSEGDMLADETGEWIVIADYSSNYESFVADSVQLQSLVGSVTPSILDVQPDFSQLGVLAEQEAFLRGNYAIVNFADGRQFDVVRHEVDVELDFGESSHLLLMEVVQFLKGAKEKADNIMTFATPF